MRFRVITRNTGKPIEAVDVDVRDNGTLWVVPPGEHPFGILLSPSEWRYVEFDDSDEEPK